MNVRTDEVDFVGWPSMVSVASAGSTTRMVAGLSSVRRRGRKGQHGHAEHGGQQH